MGQTNIPARHTDTRPHKDKHKSRTLQPAPPNDNLNNALGTIRVLGLEMIEVELGPHLNTVLVNIRERNKGAAEQVVISGILPILALTMRHRGTLTLLTIKLVAELAKESVVRKGFADAGLVPALLSVLTSKDQELLLHAATAISRMTHDSPKLQDLFLRRGAVPRLVAILLCFTDTEALEEACLLALCNLSGMAVAEEAGIHWERCESGRLGECFFHGVPPHTCGFISSVTLVHVSQWAPGQYAVSVELFQRWSSSFWSLHRKNRIARRSPFTKLEKLSSLCKEIKLSLGNDPQTQSLRTRMFHTFL